jgi:hypothetical protein
VNKCDRIAVMVGAGLTAVAQQQIDQARELLKAALATIERDPHRIDRKAKADVAELALAICRAQNIIE